MIAARGTPLALALAFGALGCGEVEPTGPASIAYEVQGQDAVRIRHESGTVARRADLVFRAGSGQARGCSIVAGAGQGVEVGSESELVLISLADFRRGQEVKIECARGTDLRYFRGDIGNGRIVPFDSVQEIPFRNTNMLWVVFLSGIAGLMLLSFALALLLDRLFGRVGEPS